MKIMKTFLSMLLILALTMTASASTISVITVGDRDGEVGANGGVVNTTANLFFCGDKSPTFPHVYYGVVKYALPAELTGQTITDATVNIRVIAHTGGTIYILLQKYTFDNTTAVNAADCTTASVQNIGVYSALPGSFMSWDVTSALQSDVDNGYLYSAYRATAVVSETDLTPIAIPGGWGVNCCSAEGEVNVPAYVGLSPRLDVEYVPEPVTIALLALGGCATLIRRKA